MDPVDVTAVLLCLGAFGYALMAARLLRGPREAGDLPIALTAATLGLWVLGGGIQLMATSPLVFSTGRLGHFVGAALASVALLVAFRAYTGTRTRGPLLVGLLVIPVATIAVSATNASHGLMWSGEELNAAGEYLARPTTWGPWFLFVHAPYSYTLVLAAILKLLQHSPSVGQTHRRGLFALAGASAVPLAAAFAYDTGVLPATQPFVPMVLTAMLPVYAWLILGARVVEFSPIAYETVFRNMADPIVVLDDRGRVVSLNRGAEQLLHVRESGAFRTSLERLFGDEVPEVYEALETGLPRKLVTNTGRFLHLQVSPIEAGSSTTRAGRVLMFRDVSDVENAQAEVRSSEILLRTLFDHSVNGLVRLRWQKTEDAPSPQLLCLSANKAAARFLGVDADDVVDLGVDELLAIATAGMSRRESLAIRDQFHAAIAAGSVIDTEVRPGERASESWLRMIGEAVGDKVAVTFIDATGTKAREEQMESMATTDALTGVLNRRGFERKASTRLADSADDATGALLFIDLNQFKQVNDRCGHDAGDQLLKVAADRLHSSLRPQDIIGRPGGDEFVALVPDVASEVAEELAERLTAALEQPYRIGEETLFCSASIGLALYPEHANTLTGLLRCADEAMYRAKSRSYALKEISRRHLLEKAG